MNCGECGRECTAPNGGTPTCKGGECEVRCDSGLTACDGACVDTKTDPDHCGECGNSCQLLGLSLCNRGACGLAVLP